MAGSLELTVLYSISIDTRGSIEYVMMTYRHRELACVVVVRLVEKFGKAVERTCQEKALAFSWAKIVGSVGHV